MVSTDQPARRTPPNVGDHAGEPGSPCRTITAFPQLNKLAANLGMTGEVSCPWSADTKHLQRKGHM
jgi:hypothetical protein